MTAFNSQEGGFHKTTVGRVQTPTLAILIEREDGIKKFVSRSYWEVHGTFAAKAGKYNGRWFEEKFAKDKKDVEQKAERLWDQENAETIRAKCQNKPGIVSEESKPTTEICPCYMISPACSAMLTDALVFPPRRRLGWLKPYTRSIRR